MLIDEFTGQIRARRSFDREEEPRIGFTVYADGKWSTAMHQGTLNILDQNDNSPVFELGGTAQFVIDSQRIGIGEELFRIRCHDLDDGRNGYVTYNANSSFFGINAETGIMQLLKFPYDLSQLQFYVTATDGGEQPRHSSIRVIVEIKEDERVSFQSADVSSGLIVFIFSRRSSSISIRSSNEHVVWNTFAVPGE